MLCMNLVVESRPSAAEVMEWVNEAVLLQITVGGRASAETGGIQHFAMRLNNYLQYRFGATMRGHVRWDFVSAGPPNAITWNCTVYINDEVYGVGEGHSKGASRDAAARHVLETLERRG
ncbi:hypothetical protein M405DRAFT_230359 [Rhizopogon salebrosus TDB-379]|nr:hypothetical protein M405DRAFT_230359 [Rhizopogon salebrosus TDB-379]